jgi:hypothetical protein
LKEERNNFKLDSVQRKDVIKLVIPIARPVGNLHLRRLNELSEKEFTEMYMKRELKIAEIIKDFKELEQRLAMRRGRLKELMRELGIPDPESLGEENPKTSSKNEG